MIVSINQPAYLPWAGYFDRIACSDLHIVLDHVQFEKNSLVNRNKIRTPQGSMYLTVPVRTKGQFGELSIQSLTTSQPNVWSQKHLKALKANYARAPYFADHIDFFEELYSDAGRADEFLPMAMRFINHVVELLEIDVPLKLSSEMELKEKKSDLILEICRSVGATTYLSGPMGRDYLDTQKFHDQGIGITFHSFSPPDYKQCWKGFESHLSIVDLLMNLSTEDIRSHMAAGRQISES